VSIEFSSNLSAIIDAWKGKPAELNRAMHDGLRDGLRAFEGQRLIREQLSGRKSNYYGLNRQTGAAANSLNVRMFREGLDTVGVITTSPQGRYLKAHQHYNFEGYIRPRNATLLAIPVHPAARGRWPSKDFAGQLFMVKKPGGLPVLARVKYGKKSAKLEIMYALKPNVYIPKRLYFFEEFKTFGRDMIKTNIMERIKEAMRAN